MFPTSLYYHSYISKTSLTLHTSSIIYQYTTHSIFFTFHVNDSVIMSKDNTVKILQNSKSLIELDWIMDETKNDPAFSRARFDKIYKNFKSIKKSGGTFELVNILGDSKTFEVKPGTLNYEGTELQNTIAMGYNSYHKMADENPTPSPHKIQEIEDRRYCPFNIILTVTLDPHDCKNTEGLEEGLRKWKSYWESSNFQKNLVSYLKEGAKQMVKVKQIVCFGLGSLGSGITTYPGATFIQHLAACAIRDTLETNQTNQHGLRNPQRIPIYAQYPAYCKTCKRILREQCKIEVIEDADGFDKINENTFVVSISPDVPVRQIVGDISVQYNGPAGMLCDEIASDGMEYDQQSYDRDVPYDRYRYHTDPSSPNLAAYRDRCAAFSLNDMDLQIKERVFGQTALYLKPSGKQPALE